MKTATEAAGYTWCEAKTDPEKEPPDNREAIVKSIEAGKPVVAMDLDGGMDWGVIAGYLDGGKKLLCRTYERRGEEYSPQQKWPWLVWVLERKAKPPDRKATIVGSLRQAVDLANTPKYDRYISGFAAYEAWVRDLSDEARFENLDQKALHGQMHANAWCYYSLYDARASASRYLFSVKGVFPTAAAGHMLKAAELFKQIACKLRDGQRYAPFPRQLQGHPWTKEMRAAEAEVLREVMVLEREAVSEIETALREIA